MICRLFRWLFGKGCEHKYEIIEIIRITDRYSDITTGYEYVSRCGKCGKITVKRV